MRRHFIIILITAMLLQYGSFCVHGVGVDGISAKFAAVIEANSGKLIYGKNENSKASMASTTKIMTALLLCETVNLDDEIIVTKEMVNVEGTSMGLKAGDKAHYRDLLYGMLLASGNDAANATAISISGSIHNFAELMNKKAKQIGMKNTNFVTPSGLDDKEHYSTAFDMAILAREAMNNADFASACSTKIVRLEYGNPPYKRTITNHNKLLKMYEGCVGIKTGFTKKSGRCLVSYAKRDNKKVITVTLNAPDDWNDHKELLDYGFSRIDYHELNLPDFTEIKVLGALCDSSKVYVEPKSVSLIKSDFKKVYIDIKVNNYLPAPLEYGDIIGVVRWKLDKVIIAESSIKIACDIDSSISLSNHDYSFWIERLFSA